MRNHATNPDIANRTAKSVSDPSANQVQIQKQRKKKSMNKKLRHGNGTKKNHDLLRGLHHGLLRGLLRVPLRALLRARHL